MSEQTIDIAIVVLAAMLAGWLLIALTVWIISEIEERKWRRRLSKIDVKVFPFDEVDRG